MRLQGLADALDVILQSFGIHLAVWAVPAFAVGLFLLGLPSLRRVHRMQVARRGIRELRAVEPTERKAREAEILALVHGHPEGLLAVVSEARRLGHGELVDRALRSLERTGKAKDELARLERELHPKAAPLAIEEELAVRRLVEQGLDNAARERLDRALERWPDHEGLSSLKEELFASR